MDVPTDHFHQRQFSAIAKERRVTRRDMLVVPSLPDIDGAVGFCRLNQMLIPTDAGVYLIHDLRGTLYVGKTKDLQRRFGQHYERDANPFLRRACSQPLGELMFSWMVVRDAQQRAALEHRLVKWIHPPCNCVLPSFSDAKTR